MMSRTVGLSAVLLVVLAGLSGLLLMTPRSAVAMKHCVSVEPGHLTFEEMLAQTDLKVIGKVSSYAPQQGPYHDIMINVSSNLKGNDPPHPGQMVAIAAEGNSPLDDCPSPSRDPQIGQQVIVFGQLADLSTGGSVTRRTHRLLSYYVLVGDEIYRGGPDDETIQLVDLLHRMQEIASAKLTPEDAGMRLADPPPGMLPLISMEQAFDIAAAQYGLVKTTPPDHRSARFVIVTYPEHWQEPTWLLTLTGLRLLPLGCHPGMLMLTATPLPCGYNSEMNIMIDAMTGEYMGAFTFR